MSLRKGGASSSSSPELHLVTIRFSHFNEQARWALDRFRVPYTEEPYVPILHMLPVRLATARWGKHVGKPDAVSSAHSTPLLMTPDGPIQDSRDIGEYVSKVYGNGSLYPCEETRKLVDEFHDRLGPQTRRAAYFFVLQEKDLFLRLAKINIPTLQYFVVCATWPIIRAGIANGLGVAQDRAMRCMERVRDIFEEVSQRLSDGRPYLMGNQFTAADIAFCCMGAPALLPQPEEGYGGRLPSIQDLRATKNGARFADFVEQLRATPAGKYALRMFAQERGTRVIPCRPLIVPSTPAAKL